MKTFIGRITRDATVSTTKSGKKVVNFSIAENHSYTPKEGERVKITTYYTCAYWRSTGVAEYLTKGALVEISGNLSLREYTDKNGNTKAVLNVHVNDITLYTTAKATAKTKEPEEVAE